MYLSLLREERTPSFSVSYDKNLWHDFGTGEGGSIIDLVPRMEGCAEGEAVQKLVVGEHERLYPFPTNRKRQADRKRSALLSSPTANRSIRHWSAISRGEA